MPVIAAVAAPFGRDVEEDLARIARLLDDARAAGAELVVLPESAIGGYIREGASAPDVPAGLDPEGPEIAALAALAGETVVCANGDGVLGHQRKVHLPPGERFAFRAGDGFAAFDTPAGRIGMLLCYDKLFPEAVRTLALDGAEIVCCLAAWPV